jgi:serine/threonine protein kinase
MDNDDPHLSDFGLSSAIADFQIPSFITFMGGESVRWIAPELLQVSEITKLENSTSCDVYSFAGVAFYVSFE